MLGRAGAGDEAAKYEVPGDGVFALNFNKPGIRCEFVETVFEWSVGENFDFEAWTRFVKEAEDEAFDWAPEILGVPRDCIVGVGELLCDDPAKNVGER